MEELDFTQPVIVLKYIGPYLSQRLNSFGIYTLDSLLEVPYMVWDLTDGDDKETRKELKLWLTELVRNRRASQCVDPPKINRGSPHRYKVRKENQSGFNAIVQFWKDYLDYPQKLGVPRSLRGRGLNNSYPLSC